MEPLYRIGSAAYHGGLRLAARLGHRRATEWVAGRSDQRRAVDRIQALHAAGRPIVWLHAASLGEFEQGRPVLAVLREARPELAVVVTFFSPSGYARCRDTELAEVVAYLPEDHPTRAREWVALLRPRLAVFVKYEFWYYHLRALRRAEVPTVLIAGSFRPGQLFFKPYGGWWREHTLGGFTALGVQTPRDADLLRRHGLTRVEVTGDPRIDRTLDLARTDFTDPRLEDFTRGHPTLLAGSVWPPDVDAIAEAWLTLPDDWRLILAPHQLKEEELMRWADRFGAQRYTQAANDSRVLLLDTIGILSRAYRFGRIAYVGGAFGSGLHNTLEPLSYGLPVVFGPRYHKFPEAVECVRRGGAYSIASGRELSGILNKLRSSEDYASSVRAQREYARQHAGAAAKTLRFLLKYLPLLLLALPLSGQSWSTADRLVETLDATYAKCNLMAAISNMQWRPGLCLAAADLATGATVSLKLPLRADMDYAFIASVEGEGADLDLFIRGGDSILARDTEADATPVVKFRPAAEGTYTLQLHLNAGDTARRFVALGMLSAVGTDLSDRRYREASRQLGAAAGAVRAAGGADTFRNGPNTWCAFGYLVAEGRGGVTLDDLYLPAGSHFAVAAGGEDIEDIDLFLARGEEILRGDRDPDAYPMLDYRNSEPDRYRLRLQVEKAGGTGLVLLGLLSK